MDRKPSFKIFLRFALCYFTLFSGCQSKYLPDGFVYLDEEIENLAIDLRYFSQDNFVGDTIDGYEADRCIITEQASTALQGVQDALAIKGYGLKIYDAYRPQQAVDHFVRWAEDLNDTRMKKIYYPEVNKANLFEQGYIAAKSGHSRGSTVDLTIIHLDGPDAGKELDMGTGWDFFSPLSWPSNKEVSEQQFKNRMLLQEVMVEHGFKPLKEEWWHFTLSDEPFPETYFDFPVK